MLELGEIIFVNGKIINGSLVLTLNNFLSEVPKIFMVKGILGEAGNAMERSVYAIEPSFVIVQ